VGTKQTKKYPAELFSYLVESCFSLKKKRGKRKKRKHTHFNGNLLSCVFSILCRMWVKSDFQVPQSIVQASPVLDLFFSPCL
jgi:hypothetical protein